MAFTVLARFSVLTYLKWSSRFYGEMNPRRFPDVEGFEDRKNDLVYASPLEEPEGVAVFFPGDVQVLKPPN